MHSHLQNALHIGCAGWAIPRTARDEFPREGSHLQQYAARLHAVEINSSFYRPHQRATYTRWASSVGENFRFSVKMPRTITHERRLVDATDLLDRLLNEVSGLGDKLGCLLVQLPPSLVYDEYSTRTFLTSLRVRFSGAVAIEPRHQTWFTASAESLLVEQRMSRVVADPATVEHAAVPGGDPPMIYCRLHGSPKMYYSAYSSVFLAEMEQRIRDWVICGVVVWCIFDNTALGAASLNALELQQRILGDASITSAASR
ncbi:MAG: DUF72 domain-containing protein [Gemmatimonadaceae bacterium]